MIKKLAKIVDYGFSLSSQKRTPQIQVCFKTAEDEVYYWRGNISEASVKYTIKTLRILGFSADDLGALASGPASNALNREMEYQITLETKMSTNGKEYTSVAFVNLPGSGEIGGKLTENEVMNLLKNMPYVKAEILAEKKQNPTSADGIPF